MFLTIPHLRNTSLSSSSSMSGLLFIVISRRSGVPLVRTEYMYFLSFLSVQLNSATLSSKLSFKDCEKNITNYLQKLFGSGWCMTSTWWLERSLVRAICLVRAVYISDILGRAFSGMFLWLQSTSMSSCLCFLFSSSRRLCFSQSSCAMDLFWVFPIPNRLQALLPKALFFPSRGSVALPLPRGGRGSKSYSCVLIFAGGIKVALDRPWSPFLLCIPRWLHGGILLSISDLCGFSAISMTSFLELYLNPFNVRRCFAISVNTSTIAYPLNLDLELKCTCVLEFSLREGVVLSPRNSFISFAVVSVVIFPTYIFVFLWFHSFWNSSCVSGVFSGIVGARSVVSSSFSVWSTRRG